MLEITIQNNYSIESVCNRVLLLCSCLKATISSLEFRTSVTGNLLECIAHDLTSNNMSNVAQHVLINSFSINSAMVDRNKPI